MWPSIHTENLEIYKSILGPNSYPGLLFVLADPGKARGCSTNTYVTKFINKAKAISAKIFELNLKVQLYNPVFIWLIS